MSRTDVNCLQSTSLNFIMNKMTINHYVFSSLMKNGICCNMKSCLIIIELKSSHEMSNLKILKQREIPSDLTSGDSHDSILSFGRRSRDNGLLLGMPRNERIPQKNAETSDWSMGIRTSSPIRITKSLKLHGICGREKQALPWSTFEIL